MLIDDANRYIALRRSLGFKLEKTGRHLSCFTHYAKEHGDIHVRAATALAWAEAVSSTRDSRYRRLQEIALFARFLHAEDPAHEVPNYHLFYRPKSRPAPYIYSPEEIVRMLDAAGRLRRQKPSPLRRHVHVMLLGLLASTGLRVSEALNLMLGDLLPNGVLHIRQTKFNKSRLVPMHASVVDALHAYLVVRQRIAGTDDHLFLSVNGKPMSHRTTVHSNFQVILAAAGVGQDQSRRPRIHDLRHTFATRVLEQCATRRESVARDFIALSTYLGHGNIKHTYWYLEATPDLMADIASAAEALVAGEVA
ncbi:tyrosine-type recombinase/integrase [Phyllobacterium chamaecytisi]|uniref:tyrosine-type recombinase/integrase n=1 Tax=Phyllobacterium chamaecytisi TaxID=2876082 RepID=UPI001CCA762E|nr:tyrosine-type recombinase/integrase [Phyllobacterium sp. KW56]MBZ9606180.1 tyrosine-type recombinase/integrase [Phyllobacterium sp. KW56]